MFRFIRKKIKTTMQGNYIALYIHLIWTTKNRSPFLEKRFRYLLLDHIREISVIKGIKINIINGVEDHLHCFVSMKPTQSVSKIVKDLKGESSRWLNEQKWLNEHFDWQDGYGRFAAATISVSPQKFDTVMNYIYSQESHHAFRSLDDELKLFEMFSER
jgi:putative transposase